MIFSSLCISDIWLRCPGFTNIIDTIPIITAMAAAVNIALYPCAATRLPVSVGAIIVARFAIK
jgi:hypothetical protein